MEVALSLMDNVERDHAAEHTIRPKPAAQNVRIADAVLKAHSGNARPGQRGDFVRGRFGAPALHGDKHKTGLEQKISVAPHIERLWNDPRMKAGEIGQEETMDGELGSDPRPRQERDPPAGEKQKAANEAAESARAVNGDMRMFIEFFRHSRTAPATSFPLIVKNTQPQTLLRLPLRKSRAGAFALSIAFRSCAELHPKSSHGILLVGIAQHRMKAQALR